MNPLSKMAALGAFLLFTLPLAAPAQSQTQSQEAAQDGGQGKAEEKKPNIDKGTDHGYVDFGVRFATGDVYGRPDLPFDPVLKTSKFNEYRDVRNGFFLRQADIRFDNILNTKNYVSFQSSKAIYRDQSYLASFGQYGKFLVQFRYDEIPHIYSNTTRTLFVQTSPGTYVYPALIRQTLQATSSTNLPSVINTQLVPQFNFITPQIIRRGGTASVSYDLTPHWNFNAMYFRESQRGDRPIGLIMNSSPSASATSGFGMELPEPIRYYNNLVRVGLDYGQKSWTVAGAYIGSFFQNDIHQLTWDNPFAATGEKTNIPLTGRMALYPDNQANYLNVAGAAELGRYVRFMASITPGWLRQNEAFLPYSTNTAINTCGPAANQACTSLATLPEGSLHGDAQTLAMNYTLVSSVWKSVELKANYRHYDYNDNTPVFTFTPAQGDASDPDPGGHENTPFGFNRKNLEVTGTWYFAKKSSAKFGYEAEWMDRSHRDAAHSLENSWFGAVDWVPIKDLLFRVSYRHSDRKPDSYQDEVATDPVTGLPVLCSDVTNVNFTVDQRCHRRFDEAARLRDKADGLLQYSPSDKLTLSVFAGTLQNNYNRHIGTNSPTPLNFLTGAAATTSPYFLYGLLKDISYNIGFDADYALSSQVTVFAEYSHEKNYTRMISRNRTSVSPPGTILTCTGCDSANNDWESLTREPVDIYTIGTDLYLGHKTYLTTYYSLSASKGNVLTHPLGDPTITTGPNSFVLNGTSAAVDYPQTTSRLHDLAVVLKLKLTENLQPRIEYRYQQWDNRDYQTSAMTPYMGCVSPIPNGPPVTNAVPGCTTPILLTNTPNPGTSPSPFYPGFVVGDTSAARYLFLGVDQPSYHAHIIMATLEYRF
jgi:MtrB/PioB family decaheme-associated outer membrane protein